MTTYEDAGVSLARGDAASEDALRQMKATFKEYVVLDLGLPVVDLFAAIPKHWRRPMLRHAVDGVGTKLIYAANCRLVNTVGEDLVAMCTDDLARYNIRPLAFSAYRGANFIDERTLSLVVWGIVSGCKKAEIPYTAGETAEMPGFYVGSHFELVGFCDGIYEHGTLRYGQDTKAGDILIALPSLGPGSNGFSLIRSVFPPEEVVAGKSPVTCEEVLRPTSIYTRQVLKANERYKTIRGWAHITGGGLGEKGKLAKLLPRGLCASLDRESWKVPSIFLKVQQVGNISDEVMFSTFNMGLMMIAPVQNRQANNVVQFFESLGIPAAIVGRVEKQKGLSKELIV